MKKISIKPVYGEKYDVIIDSSFDELEGLLKKADYVNSRVALFTDKKIMSLYGDTITDAVKKNNCEIISIILDELDNKSIMDILEEKGVSVNDVFISLGSDNNIVDTDNIISEFVMKQSEADKIKYISIPTSLKAMAEDALTPIVRIDFDADNDINSVCPTFVFINVDCLTTLEEKDFYNGFAFIMKNAILKGINFYMWLISNMYEICEKDSDVLQDMIEKSVKVIKNYIEASLDIKDLEFGEDILQNISGVMKLGLMDGEYLALGIIFAAFISKQKDILSLEEYLEIRDMFVPFNLPITMEPIDVDDIVADINFEDNEYVLLDKLGKTAHGIKVTNQDIRDAFKEIIFDEEGMDAE